MLLPKMQGLFFVCVFYTLGLINRQKGKSTSASAKHMA